MRTVVQPEEITLAGFSSFSGVVWTKPKVGVNGRACNGK